MCCDLLDAGEQPPALNWLFGGAAWLVLPGAAPAAVHDAWMRLAAQWQARYPGLRTIEDHVMPQRWIQLPIARIPRLGQRVTDGCQRPCLSATTRH